MRIFVLALFIFVFEIHLCGQNSVSFNEMYKESSHYGFPFYLKGNESNVKALPLDTSSMKNFFDIQDFVYEVGSFDSDTETWMSGDSYIMNVWINNSWTYGHNKCFVLASWKEVEGDYDGENLIYFCVTSNTGSLIDKLTINEHDDAKGRYCTFVVIDEKTFIVFCYENNWSNYENIRNSSGEITGTKLKDKNAPSTIIHVNKYIITEEGRFQETDQFDVPKKNEYIEYKNRKILDDPFYEYLK